MKRTLLILSALALRPLLAETVGVADCERDARLDFWAAADVKFCRNVMDEVFKAVGVEPVDAPFDDDGVFSVSNAEVICSAFRTPHLLKDYSFPFQPLGRMHFALYATPSRAMAMMSTKITDWPRMRVGYSPVSQGQIDNHDREKYFEHAKLSPEYVEFPTSAGAVKALHEGDIDALFLYTPFGKRPEGVVEVVPIGARNVYFAVRKDRPELFRKLAAAYRDVYIDRIGQLDAWREALLGIPKPRKRVRIAAYSRGDLFAVTPDGEHSGALDMWMKTITGHTRWTLDYVYGGYDESISDVMNGRLDLIGGVGYASTRRDKFLYPHTSIGMLRVYLWTHPGNDYRPNEPETWTGMKVGMLAGTISAARAKRQFDSVGIAYTEYATDKAMLQAYFGGEVDACIDVEMPELAGERTLHVYASHPMYICAALGRKKIFEELETALEEVCDDFPKYMRMIDEHHYGIHSQMAAFSLQETEWLNRRAKSGKPVLIDFSPWPFDVFDKRGRPTGFVARLLAELSNKTGVVFMPQPQTGVQTAEAKFMRGDTDLWVPYPEVAKEATYGARSVFALPVPASVADFYGVKDNFQDLELFARPSVPKELVSVIQKTVSGMDAADVQEMFIRDVAEHTVVHRVFGLTKSEMVWLIVAIGAFVVAAAFAYGIVMMRLLKREAACANEAAKLAEEHAQAKTRFLAMMSHELRTPLNAVIGFAEFLNRPDTDERLRKEYTDGILMSSNALLELINDILDLSKLEAGAMQMRSGVCDMNRLLKELPAIFGYRVRSHGVRLRVELPPSGAIPLLGLSQQGMRQILINLVGNAAKFTEQGEIAVETSWDPDSRSLHMEVSDTGCGISESKMAHLFDPFVQDIASRMKVSAGEIKGTGLGLPIVKRMVESAGGTIRVDSIPGRGTRFFIDIPGLDLAAPEPAAETAGEKTLQLALPDRVLVVDDMTMNRKILGIHLKNLKIKDVRFAENGEVAISVMDEWVPDLVLTDMWMPRMDGTQLAEAMRRDRRLAEVPVVAVTADVDVGSTYDMSLFAKIISKPVTTEKLLELFGQEAK